MMSSVSKEELIADLIYFFIALLVSAIAIYAFDIHWSFYPGGTIFPPNRHIFNDATPYYIGIPIGGIVGFFLLKLIFFAFIEERKAHKKDRKELVIKITKNKAYMGKN